MNIKKLFDTPNGLIIFHVVYGIAMFFLGMMVTWLFIDVFLAN